MKTKSVISGLLALAISGATALAGGTTCSTAVSGVVSCPNGNSQCGIVVCVQGVGSTTTDSDGSYFLDLPGPGTYTICVDPTSLPTGTTVSGCQQFTVDCCNAYACIDFCLSGSICCPPPPSPSRCWLTGGGTISKTKGQPDYSFGGVVNPGCSPTAAGGGNWNVVDHVNGLHFKGLNIVVVNCGGVATKSPKVNVNTIDFTGVGTITGVEGNSFPTTLVTFVGHAEDHAESGANKDLLQLNAIDGSGNVLLHIDSLITTGNLQIHTSGCNK